MKPCLKSKRSLGLDPFDTGILTKKFKVNPVEIATIAFKQLKA